MGDPPRLADRPAGAAGIPSEGGPGRVDPPQAPRLHFMDGLRGVLMVLGIPFHAAVAFSGQDWVVANDTGSTTLYLLGSFINVWRMPAFFVVAGFFALLVLRRRGPGPWYRGRLVRLGVPLLFGMALINPLQSLVRARFRFGSWPEALGRWGPEIIDGGTWHLWFLVNLLVYCAVLALVHASPLRPVLARSVAAVVLRATRSLPVLLASMAAAALAATAGVLVWRVSGVGELVDGVLSESLVELAPAFVLGVALAVRPVRLRDLVGRHLAPLALLGAACLAARLALATIPPDGPVVTATNVTVTVVGGLSWAMAALGLAARLGDRRNIVVDYVVDASLSVYLVHHLIVVCLAVWLIPTDLLPLPAFLLTVVVTVLGSFAVYELVNTTPCLRFLMTGQRARRVGLRDVLGARRASVPCG